MSRVTVYTVAYTGVWISSKFDIWLFFFFKVDLQKCDEKLFFYCWNRIKVYEILFYSIKNNNHPSCFHMHMCTHTLFCFLSLFQGDCSLSWRSCQSLHLFVSFIPLLSPFLITSRAYYKTIIEDKWAHPPLAPSPVHLSFSFPLIVINIFSL